MRRAAVAAVLARIVPRVRLAVSLFTSSRVGEQGDMATVTGIGTETGITIVRIATRPWTIIAVHLVLRAPPLTNTDLPTPPNFMDRTAHPPRHPPMNSPRMARDLARVPVPDTLVTPHPVAMAATIPTWIAMTLRIIAPEDRIVGKLCRVAPVTIAPRTGRHVRKRIASTSTVHRIVLARITRPIDHQVARRTTTSIAMEQDLQVLRGPIRSQTNLFPI